MKETGFLFPSDPDASYTLRQVEVMVNNFPQYNWFDPMTAFPTGKVIDWGPLFPFIIALLCLLTGATTHSAIIYFSSWIPPLMAALMVPVTYLIGKIVWDWKTGIVAAGLISFVSVTYFFYGFFGKGTHHIAETLFSSLFFLVYLYYLTTVNCSISNMKNLKTMIIPVFLASLAGILYFFALITSTTTLLILMVIAIYTFIQNIIDHLANRPFDNLLVLNIIFLSVSTILLVLFGYKQPGLSVTSYTIGLVIVNLALIVETVVIYGISAVFRGKTKPYMIFLGILIGVGVVFLVIWPPLHSISQQVIGLYFGSSNFSLGVSNTAPLNLSSAWQNLNVALILTSGGFLVLIYHIVKKWNPECIFLLIWSVLMVLISVQYVRFLYFSTVNIVILSAICITEPFTWRKNDGTALTHGIPALRFFPYRSASNEQQGCQEKKTSRFQETNKKLRIKKPLRNSKNSIDIAKGLSLVIVVILAVVLVAVSVNNDFSSIMKKSNRERLEISPDWVESLIWMKTNTPSPGVEYFQQYDASTFTYPSEAYGILAPWSVGHWITFFSHRIPITNPFQDNLGGNSGANAFFMSQNESHANNILQELGGRYVITTADLTITDFASLGLWVNNYVDISPYLTQFWVPRKDNPSRFSTYVAYNDAYFRMMIVRLHNFDGSMQAPTTIDYVQYTIQQVPATDKTSDGIKSYIRVINNDQKLDISQPHNDIPIVKEGINISLSDKYKNVFSDSPNKSLEKVNALEHYRLVHESPNNASVSVLPGSITTIVLSDIKYVKIFEYVTGARIPGNGIIEIPIRTNTGRIFVYRQESEAGEFIVPYSTSGNPYDVRTDGPYHIVETDRYIDVTEKDVMEGNTVDYIESH